MTSLFIKKLETAIAEPDMLSDAIIKANSYPNAQVSLYCHPRTPEGWAEWSMEIKRGPTSTPVIIGVIQRKVGAKTEFHS